MAKKTAAMRLFFIAPQQKTIYLNGRGPRTGHRAEKIAAVRLFFVAPQKNNLSQWPWPGDGPHGRKNSRYAAIFCCSATKNNLSPWPWSEDGPHGQKNSRYAAIFYHAACPPPFLRAWASSFSNVSSLISCSMRQASSAAVFSLTPSRTKNSVSSLWRS